MSPRAAGLLLAGLVLAASSPAAAAQSKEPAPGVLQPQLRDATGTVSAFITFAHPVRDADLDRLRALGATRWHRFRLIPTVAVVVPADVLRQAALWPDVTAVRTNDRLHLADEQSRATTKVDAARVPRPRGLGLTGRGVGVAVLDSGLDSTHPDFDGRVKAFLNFEGAWVYDQYQDGAASDQAAAASAALAQVDEVGHGTHVAGIIAGTGAAAQGRDLSGVAPGADLVIARLASGAQGQQFDFGYEMNAMLALEHLAEHQRELGVRIVNNSWTVYEVDDPATEPIVLMALAAVRSGLTLVFAAGNNGPGGGTVGWPGALGSVITVSATTNAANPAVAGFSSRGYQVDLAAPGASILSARSTQRTSASDPAALAAGGGDPDSARYLQMSGTSMAAPHVAGIAALLLEANPRLRPTEIEEVLTRTAVDRGDPGKDHGYGYGFVDAHRAGKVALCLATRPSQRRESCFTANDALPRAAWRSDANDPGNRGPTHDDPPPIL